MVEQPYTRENFASGGFNNKEIEKLKSLVDLYFLSVQMP